MGELFVFGVDDMLSQINSAISAFVWGPPMLAVFLGTGLFLSAKTGFFQIFGIKKWVRSTVFTVADKEKRKAEKGSVSQLGALTSALAACLGTGNIIGVATALCSGGPGAVFWTWVSAVLGMMTCCCENILGIKYRIRNKEGNWAGGPMYYIERGLGMKGLAGTYAVLLTGASLGMGNMTQSNSVAAGLSDMGVPPAVTAVAVCVPLAFAVTGGLERISSLTQKLIPVLSLAFIAACFVIIGANLDALIPSIRLIFKEAFTVKAVSGFGMAKAMRYGVSRGVFSNEAGLGSSAVIHSCADCDSPAKQGMWGIVEVFIDTVFMCTVTAAAILVSGVWSPETSLNGVALCSAVFESVMGRAGGIFLNVCICLFAFSTLVAWSFYGRSGTEYLFGAKGGKIYNVVYIAAAFAGCLIKLDAVWTVSDTLNGLMAVPNIFALWLMSKEATGEINSERKTRRSDRRIQINCQDF